MYPAVAPSPVALSTMYITRQLVHSLISFVSSCKMCILH